MIWILLDIYLNFYISLVTKRILNLWYHPPNLPPPPSTDQASTVNHYGVQVVTQLPIQIPKITMTDLRNLNQMKMWSIVDGISSRMYWVPPPLSKPVPLLKVVEQGLAQEILCQYIIITIAWIFPPSKRGMCEK